LNLPYADWNGNTGCNIGTQAFINSWVWENGFTQVVDSPTRGAALLDVYLARPEVSFTASSIVQGISDHHGVILEVEWKENCCVPQVEKLVPMCQKTDSLGLQTYFRDKFATWASVLEIWNNLKDIVSESIERFFPHKILRKNTDPEYCSKEVKRLEIKVRKAQNRRKLGLHHLEELKQLSKQLFAANKMAQGNFYINIKQ